MRIERPRSPEIGARAAGTAAAIAVGMNAMSIRVDPLVTVRAEDKQAMSRFASEVTPGLLDGYVARRLESYGFVASAWDGDELRSFQLFDQRSRDGVVLTYLGPVFSNDGAYIFIFASIVRAHVDADVPFCIGMEFESDVSERALRRFSRGRRSPTMRANECHRSWARSHAPSKTASSTSLGSTRCTCGRA